MRKKDRGTNDLRETDAFNEALKLVTAEVEEEGVEGQVGMELRRGRCGRTGRSCRFHGMGRACDKAGLTLRSRAEEGASEAGVSVGD